jgi:hypothetical protein
MVREMEKEREDGVKKDGGFNEEGDGRATVLVNASWEDNEETDVTVVQI